VRVRARACVCVRALSNSRSAVISAMVVYLISYVILLIVHCVQIHCVWKLIRHPHFRAGVEGDDGADTGAGAGADSSTRSTHSGAGFQDAKANGNENEVEEEGVSVPISVPARMVAVL
jgi:hypothetical protein